MKTFTLREIKPDDPNYYKPLDELIEDLGHAKPASRYGDVQIMVEDLTDAIHYLQEYKAILPLIPSLINTALEIQKKGKTIG